MYKRQLVGDNIAENGGIWTPQPASETESSDNGLPVCSGQPHTPLTPAASQTHETCTPLPVDPSKCKARTWKRALLPHLPQCSRKVLPGHDYCQAHVRICHMAGMTTRLTPACLQRLKDHKKESNARLRSDGIAVILCSSKHRALGDSRMLPI